jgi:hypothetical protein
MPTGLRRGQIRRYKLRRGQKLRRRSNRATSRNIYAEDSPRCRLRQRQLCPTLRAVGRQRLLEFM